MAKQRMYACAGAVVAAAATAWGLAAASTGSGTFRFDKVTTKFVSACAFQVPDPLVAGKTQTRVVLADRPIDCVAADAGFDPLDAVKAQVGANSAWFSFAIEDGGQRADGEWSSPKQDEGSPFGVGGQGRLVLALRTAQRIEGRWHTPKPETFFKQTFEFDVRFAADVLTGSTTGTALPKGGGEHGTVFRAYLKAIAASDERALQAAMTRGGFAEKAPSLAVLRDLELKTATIAGGLVKGDAAVLNVDGVSHGGLSMRGRVFMAREDGAWKIVDTKLRAVY